MKMFEWLKLPETRHIKDLDDPAVTRLHGAIVRKKGFLRRLYTDFYREFKTAVGTGEGKTLVELGSGGGFLKEVIPQVITSEILPVPQVDRIFSATEMPFAEETVDAFFLLDVLHHIEQPRAFFREAIRCLKPGGKLVMIEPANTWWSRLIFRNLHHEPFDTTAGWDLKPDGPLSQANGALPWIIFSRDRRLFDREFSALRVVRMRNHTPFRYLLSGGLTWRPFAPSWSYPLVKFLERLIRPANGVFGMFQTITLEKIARGT